ncbi:tyrosine-type recombinase/integrase [bacterium]|nr:tyrosine-type recombinase/integrase [bacterium]
MDRRIEDYLSYLESVRGLSERTLRVYGEDLDRYEAFLAGADLDAAAAHDIRAFAGSLVMEGKASSSVNRALSTIRGFYRYRMRFGGLTADPGREVENLSASSPGCRASGIAGMTVGRLDFPRGIVRILGKGSKERVVFLGRMALQALASYLTIRSMRLAKLRVSDHGRVFINARGGPLSVRGMELIVERRRVASNMNKAISPHAFRHSFATQLVGAGADIRVVQEMMGHSSISTTQVYTHVDMEHLRKVYELAHPHGTKDR